MSNYNDFLDNTGIEKITETDTLKIFTADERNKLSNIEPNATADQTGAEIKSLYEAEDNTNAYIDDDKTKIDYISVTKTVDLDANSSNISKNAEALGTKENTRYDKVLSVRDIIATEYDSDDNLVTIRYTSDNDSDAYYRDTLSYTDGDLTEVKHYFNTSDLSTESGKTKLTYGSDGNLATAEYTE